MPPPQAWVCPPHAFDFVYDCNCEFTQGDEKRTTHFKWMTLEECKQFFDDEDGDVEALCAVLYSKKRRLADGSHQTIYRVKVYEKWETVDADRRFSVSQEQQF